MSAVNKQSLEEIEITRGMAILAVLFIHITGLPVRALEPGISSYIFYTLVNRGMQFAVPLFLMISALVLAYRTGLAAEINLPEFYRKRWRRAVVPFLVWTTLYLALRFLILHDIPYISLKQGLLWYGFGKGFFHLYFLSVVIQFYLLFPVIHKWWRTCRPGFITAVLLFGTAQAAFYWVNRLYIYQHFNYTGSLVFSYIFPIGIGLWMGYNTGYWVPWWKKYRTVFVALAAAAGIFYLNRHFAILDKVKISTFYFQMAWTLYVTALGICVIFLARWLAARQGSPGALLAGFFFKTGQFSYGIYLIHPFFLLVWQKIFVAESTTAMHLSVWGGFFIILGLSCLTTYFLERTVLARPLFGVTPKK
ncbi:acyltransferase [Desulforamulus putei]|uniref:acyltransferase n=1 Tax=Desulforamulus putei TaxID=74701 RepID=UPI002FDCC1A6